MEIDLTKEELDIFDDMLGQWWNEYGGGDNDHPYNIVFTKLIHAIKEAKT